MTSNIRADIQKHINRVRRRMFGQELLRHSITAIVVAIVATIAWVLVEPFVWTAAPNWFRWAILGGVGGLGSIIAIAIAIAHRPDVTKSALWLDDAFGLRERVTTSLALSSDDAATPAGQALLADAAARVHGIKVSERFPIRVGWQGWLIPSAAGALALVMAFYHPIINPPIVTAEEKKLSSDEKASLEKKLEALQRPAKREPVVNEKGKSEDLKRLEAKLEEIAKQPRDNAQQLKERIKDLTPMEDAIKKLERERADKSRMLQQQLQMKDALSPNDNTKDGPAAEFQKSLGDGNLDKAKDELEKLAKKLANNELTPKDKEQLAKQLNNLQKKLNDLANQTQKEDMLKKLAQDGKLDQEALERELNQLKQDNEKLKDLQKLADKMNQCQNCMKSGDMAGAQKALAEAADQLAQTAREQGELDDIREQLENLRDAKDALAAALEELEQSGGEGGNGGNPNRNNRPSRSDFSDNNKGGVGAGRRSEGEQGKIRPYDSRLNGKFDPKGKKVFDGFVPGQAFKKKSSMDLAGDIKQAAQEAPEAIENQRIPKAARDMAKGYFKNLGGQADGEKAKSKDAGQEKANAAPKQ
jgi:hypothetical protein